MLSIIVAMAHHNVIGNANKLPWYLSADLQHFKKVTTGHTVIMGRKTFDSIMTRLGHPLPNRKSIVLTRDSTFQPKDVTVIHSINELSRFPEDQEVFIIGGAQLYEQALPLVQKIYLTEIDGEIDGDTFFPELEESEWQEVQREPHQKDEKNPYNYAFITLVRRKA